MLSWRGFTWCDTSVRFAKGLGGSSSGSHCAASWLRSQHWRCLVHHPHHVARVIILIKKDCCPTTQCRQVVMMGPKASGSGTYQYKNQRQEAQAWCLCILQICVTFLGFNTTQSSCRHSIPHQLGPVSSLEDAMEHNSDCACECYKKSHACASFNFQGTTAASLVS